MAGARWDVRAEVDKVGARGGGQPKQPTGVALIRTSPPNPRPSC